MKISVLTDTHLGHDKLISHGRPNDFTYLILRGLSEAKGDLLLHLGDVCLGQDNVWHSALLERAQGFKKKILVRGNHDNKSDSWYYSQGWDFVCREFSNTYFGKKLLFTHAPIPAEFLSGLDFNIHGHFHGSAEESHRYEGTMIGGGTYNKAIHRDAAPELYGYKPINLEDLIKPVIYTLDTDHIDKAGETVPLANLFVGYKFVKDWGDYKIGDTISESDLGKGVICRELLEGNIVVSYVSAKSRGERGR